MKRKIVSYDVDGTETVLAELELRPDGTVAIAYVAKHTESLRAELEQDGIVVDGHQVVRARDGRRFWDALPKAYAQSSRVAVLDA